MCNRFNKELNYIFGIIEFPVLFFLKYRLQDECRDGNNRQEGLSIGELCSFFEAGVPPVKSAGHWSFTPSVS